MEEGSRRWRAADGCGSAASIRSSTWITSRPSSSSPDGDAAGEVAACIHLCTVAGDMQGHYDHYAITVYGPDAAKLRWYAEGTEYTTPDSALGA